MERKMKKWLELGIADRAKEISEKCPDCKGEGYLGNQTSLGDTVNCPTCSGTGLPKEKLVKLVMEQSQ